ncbi:MAG: tetratricopeptide repeat protein [Caldimicrobium sp.]
MKKNLSLMSLIVSLLMGCLPDEDISSLKIKVLNLETLTQSQEVKIKQLEKNMSELEKRVDAEISQKFLQTQTKLLRDLEELRKEVVALQGKMDDLTFQQEGERKGQIKAIEDLRTRIETVEVKIKEVEKKVLEKSSNQTPTDKGSFDNATTSQLTTQGKSNETLSSERRKENTITQVQPSDKVKTQEETSKNEKKDGLKEEELYHKAHTLYSKGDLKGARSLWEEYLKRFPKGKWVGQTYFYIGETYFKEKDYESAILSYQKLIEMPGPNPLKPKAMLRQGDAFLNLKDKKAAQIIYKKIIQNFPGTPEAKEAEQKLKEL